MPPNTGAGSDVREPRPVILYDGECGLCNRWVKFVLRFDRREIFAFSALQSAFAEAVLREGGLAGGPPRTVVVVDGGRLYTESDAVLRIASELGFPWRLATPLRFIPAKLRNAAYRLVARHRHRLFPKPGSCALPGAGRAGRFLE